MASLNIDSVKHNRQRRNSLAVITPCSSRSFRSTTEQRRKYNEMDREELYVVGLHGHHSDLGIYESLGKDRKSALACELSLIHRPRSQTVPLRGSITEFDPDIVLRKAISESSLFCNIKVILKEKLPQTILSLISCFETTSKLYNL